jgi:hypothetical protein
MTRAAPLVGLILVALLAGVAAPRPALAKKSTPAGKARTAEVDTVLGGQHFRFRTDKGVVHVWVPEGYDASYAGTVVYVHGYRSSSDQSWRDYRLAAQFKASKQNAVFIVPDAPSGNEDGLHYDTLTNLLRQVWRHTRLARPWGSIVVIGHSGAFRTIVPWLDYTAIDHVILLDALYAAETKFKTWLTAAKGHQSNKITIVGEDTSGRAQAFLQQFKGVVRMKKVPGSWDDFQKVHRTARVLYIQSQFGHMELVSSGRVIPLLLRRTPLRPLGEPPPERQRRWVWADPQPFMK